MFMVVFLFQIVDRKRQEYVYEKREYSSTCQTKALFETWK